MKMISVIIATYRREQPLFNALKSLTNQTYTDFEVVVVDDNADKRWNDKVKTIIAQFNNVLDITLITNNCNQGSAKSRNIGIDASRGFYTAFLDDDDIFLPDRLKNQVDIVVRENADYSISNLFLYNEDESLCEVRKRDYLLSKECDLLLCHLKYNLTSPDTMMFKREYLIEFGGFEPIDCGDDFYLMMKAIKAGGKFVFCNSCDVKAYVHTGEGGLSSGQQKINGENRLYAFKKQYFHEIKVKDRRYIKMRHYAVLAYAYKRSRKFFLFLSFGFLAFLVSPFSAIQLIKGLKE